VARAAIEAHEFAKARAALAPLIARPTQRVALLMAELEQAEHGDIGRAREWTARAVRAERDPAWTADGFVSDRWLPVSPVTGRLDAFQWKVPLAQLGTPGPVIEEVRAEPASVAPAAERFAAAAEGAEPAVVQPASAAQAQAPAAKTARRPIPRGTRRASAPRAEPVIPLVRVP